MYWGRGYLVNHVLLNTSMTVFAFLSAISVTILPTMAGSFEDHLNHVERVMQHLTDAGFAVNIRKSSFAVTEIDYLGYWITRRGIQPQTKMQILSWKCLIIRG